MLRRGDGNQPQLGPLRSPQGARPQPYLFRLSLLLCLRNGPILYCSQRSTSLESEARLKGLVENERTTSCQTRPACGVEYLRLEVLPTRVEGCGLTIQVHEPDDALILGLPREIGLEARESAV